MNATPERVPSITVRLVKARSNAASLLARQLCVGTHRPYASEPCDACEERGHRFAQLCFALFEIERDRGNVADFLKNEAKQRAKIANYQKSAGRRAQ